MYLHAIACSNSVKALYLDDEDRRWLVPRITEKKRDEKYWIDFYAWLKADGLGIVKRFLEKYAEKYGTVGTGEHALLTTMKEEVISVTRSEGRQLAYDLAVFARDKKDERGQKEKVVLVVEEVRRWVASRCGMALDDRRLEKALALRQALVAGGMKEPKLMPGQARQRHNVRLRRGREIIKSYVVANFEVEAGTPWTELEGAHKEPKDIWPL